MKKDTIRQIAATAPASSGVSGEGSSLTARLRARGHDGKGAWCPFRVLHGMNYGSVQFLVDGMTRRALLSLFAMELEIRQNAAFATVSMGAKA